MKIKKVVIDGFRAYENAQDGTFDFSTQTGECADFVAIYAPNGFGKTSFYDAVEFALTDNISRFVRDAHRNDYDNKSKTQIQRKRKQYVLRNHSIPDSSVAKVEVTLDLNGKQEVKEKVVPKPKTGNRDFHFKKRSLDSSFSGLPDVFLSQEAIDSFLREEKADARYLRFMANFGDSDETYRANLSTLKRELDSSLEDIRTRAKQIKLIAERPIKAEIFTAINHSIALLSDEQASIIPIDKEFDADRELSIRNEITKRVHQLSQSNEDLEKAQAALTYLAERRSSFLEAIRTKKNAEKVLCDIRLDRKFFEQRQQILRAVTAYRNSLVGLNQTKDEISEILRRVPSFEAGRQRKREAVKLKDDYASSLNQTNVSLTALEKRESESKRRIDLADAAINDLLKAQEKSTSTYQQIEAMEGVVRSQEAEKKQSEKLAEALAVTVKHTRLQYELLKALKLDETLVDSPGLSLITSEEFSPIDLRAALVEMHAKLSIFEESKKAADAAKSYKTRISELVEIGHAIASSGNDAHCPLCSHPHRSNAVLLEAILNNDELDVQVESLLRHKHTAESSYNEARNRVEELLKTAETLISKRLEELRKSIEYDAEQITTAENRVRTAQHEVSRAHDAIRSLKEVVFGLPPQQFSEKISREIEQYQVSKVAELADSAKSKADIAGLKVRQKDLLQNIEAEQAKAHAVDTEADYKTVVEFCLSNQVDIQHAGQHLQKSLEKVLEDVEGLNEKIDDALSEISDLDNKNPVLANWNSDEASQKESHANQEILRSDAILVPFIASAKLYIDKFEEQLLTSELSVILDSTRDSIANEKSINQERLQLYSLLDQQLTDVRPFIESLESQTKFAELSLEVQKMEALEAALNNEYESATNELNKKIQKFFYPELINAIYRRIDPHPDFKRVEFACDFEEEKPTLEVFVADQDGDLISPNLYFSAAQVNILSLSIFLARALHAKTGKSDVGCIFIDDPIHSMDSINVLSTIDLLRSISLKFQRQVILSTHDRNFFELLQRKVPSDQCKSKFLELQTFGKVQVSANI